MRIYRDNPNNQNETEVFWTCQGCMAMLLALPSEGRTEFNNLNELGGVSFVCPICNTTTWVSELRVAKHRDKRIAQKPGLEGSGELYSGKQG